VAELSADARIRDLERRLDMDPGSRLFVSLAEEYRKVGRFKQALSALQKGLLAHPGYIAAQVALGRVYLEVNQTTDSIATFTKVLVSDPGNLVASKSLADIYHARGDKLEALKKYKLYRALSGDRKVDEVIAELESQVAPRPVTPTRSVPKAPEPLPPPPKFQETDKSKRRSTTRNAPQAPAPRLSDAFDITSLTFDPGEDTNTSKADDPFPFVPTRDMAIAAPQRATAENAPSQPAPAAPPAEPLFGQSAEPVSTPESEPVFAPPTEPVRPVPAEPLDAESAPVEKTEVYVAAESPAPSSPTPPPFGESTLAAREAPPFFKPTEDAQFGEVPQLFQPAAEEPAAPQAPAETGAVEPAPPTGRALADLYYSQGHFAEALQIYDDLVTRHPFDEDLMRMRREAEARLLPAGGTLSAGQADPAVERRRSRIRVLERWLSLVQAR
jgi:tetratricopeptide (TPR) repeat protein